MKCYIVYADTYTEDEYGSNIVLFGIFSEKKDALRRKESIEKKCDCAAFVSERELDLNCEVYLGGYIE